MANLTISLDTPAESRTFTLTTADLQTLQAAFTLALQAQGIASPTTAQLFSYWMDILKAATIAAVRQQNEASAQTGVTSIALT